MILPKGKTYSIVEDIPCCNHVSYIYPVIAPEEVNGIITTHLAKKEIWVLPTRDARVLNFDSPLAGPKRNGHTEMRL